MRLVDLIAELQELRQRNALNDDAPVRVVNTAGVLGEINIVSVDTVWLAEDDGQSRMACLISVGGM